MKILLATVARKIYIYNKLFMLYRVSIYFSLMKLYVQETFMKLPRFLITLICFLFIPSILLAQWPCSSVDAVRIVGENQNQSNSQLLNHNAFNIVVGWQDKRSGSSDNIYLQCLNKAGQNDWQLNGIGISISPGQQSSARSISNDSAIIVVWQDNRSGVDYDIYAQRIKNDAQLSWTTSGKAICTSTGNQYNPRIVSDGLDGAIIVWQDRRNNTDYNLYAQRISSNGETRWTANGVLICNSLYDQFNPKVISDGSGGAIITWQDFRVGNGYTDIYVQRVSATGSVVWQTNGTLVCNAPNNQSNIQMVPDGFKGAIIVWQDRRTPGREDIYAQKINSSGNAVWTTNGVPVSTINGYKYYPQIASDRSGGAIITWQDNRTGIDYNIYAQNLDLEGGINWQTDGIHVCTAVGHQYFPQIITDVSGNAIITWQDKRNGVNFDIYAQRVKIDGSKDWALNGAQIAIAPYDQIEPQAINDDEGGAIISWTDYRAGTGFSDIYAHRIGENGKPAGGCYRTFNQNDFTVKSERIKRPYYIPKPMPNAGNVRDTVFKRLLTNGVMLGIAKPESSTVYGWIKISRSYNAKRFLPQTDTPRPFDLRGTRYFLKQVSNPTPRTYNNRLAGELLTLKLNIFASDLGITNPGLGDLIFQDTVKDNILNGKSLRFITSFVDSSLTMWRAYSKFVNYSQLDSSLLKINFAFASPIDSISTCPLTLTNNKGVFSTPFLKLSSFQSKTFIPNTTPFDEEIPESFALFQNYPNPFNPSTTIEFDLPEASLVTLKIFNTLGQEVYTLLEMEEMDDGRNAITFEADGLPSGVYFYRVSINSGMNQQTKKMILLK